MPTVELDSFIRGVEEMLRSWVTGGYNSFIHRRLYEKGMPQCIQDAFTTLAAYNARTPAVTDTILKIAEERANTLVSLEIPAVGGAQDGVLTHLAHVQYDIRSLLFPPFDTIFEFQMPYSPAYSRVIPNMYRFII
jgi:hypothetical protein